MNFMKKLILLFAFMLQGVLAFGQDRFIYCELYTEAKKNQISKKYVFMAKIISDSCRWGSICDNTGKIREFCHQIEAVNVMADLGWELAQVYVTAGELGETHYILRRKQTSEPIETFLPRLKK